MQFFQKESSLNQEENTIREDTAFYREFGVHSTQDSVEALPYFVNIEILKSRLRVIVNEWVQKEKQLPSWKKKLRLGEHARLITYLQKNDSDLEHAVNAWIDKNLQSLQQQVLDGNVASWESTLDQLYSLFTFFGTVPDELQAIKQAVQENTLDYATTEEKRSTSIRESVAEFLEESSIEPVDAPKPHKQYVFLSPNKGVFVGEYDSQEKVEFTNLPSKLATHFSFEMPSKVMELCVIYELEDVFPSRSDYSMSDLAKYTEQEAIEPRIHTTYGSNFFAILREGVLASTDHGSVEKSLGVFVAPVETIIENGKEIHRAEYYKSGSVVFLFDINQEPIEYVNGYEVVPGPINFTHKSLRKVIFPNEHFRSAVISMIETLQDQEKHRIFGDHDVRDFFVTPQILG